MIYRQSREDVRQEEDELPWGRIALGYLATVAIALALGAWAWSTQGSVERRYRPSGHFFEAQLGPRRPVQNVRQNIFDGRGVGRRRTREGRESLDRYRYADPEHRTADIPIEEAMRSILSEKSR